MKNTIVMLLWMLGSAGPAAAQLRTTFAGAVAALNAPVATTSAPATPFIQSVSPVGLGVLSTGGVLGSGTGSIPVRLGVAPITAADLPNLLNLKDIGFAYQSSLFWWLGYFQYSQIAQGLVYSPDGSQVEFGTSGVYEPVNQPVQDAVNFFTNGNFTMFRDFPSKRINLVLSGNLPVPVQQNPDPSGTYVTYSPTRIGFSVYVPLNF